MWVPLESKKISSSGEAVGESEEGFLVVSMDGKASMG